MQINYTQCELKRNNTFQVAWIPSKFASQGNCIKLKDRKTKEWIDGWEVIKVGTTKSEKHVKLHESDYKNTRKASDI